MIKHLFITFGYENDQWDITINIAFTVIIENWEISSTHFYDVEIEKFRWLKTEMLYVPINMSKCFL